MLGKESFLGKESTCQDILKGLRNRRERVLPVFLLLTWKKSWLAERWRKNWKSYHLTSKGFSEHRLVDFSCGHAAWAKVWKLELWKSVSWFCMGLLVSPDVLAPTFQSLSLQLSRELLSLGNQKPHMSIIRIDFLGPPSYWPLPDILASRDV